MGALRLGAASFLCHVSYLVAQTQIIGQVLLLAIGRRDAPAHRCASALQTSTPDTTDDHHSALAARPLRLRIGLTGELKPLLSTPVPGGFAGATPADVCLTAPSNIGTRTAGRSFHLCARQRNRQHFLPFNRRTRLPTRKQYHYAEECNTTQSAFARLDVGAL
jgi:hypothetical protein